MLTIEEMKQAVEFADGFEIGKPGANTEYAFYLEDGLVKCSFDIAKPLNSLFVYDRFLDLVIHGMNRKRCNIKKLIEQQASKIFIFRSDGSLEKIINHNGSTEGIREAREQAIRFVLEEMK